MTRQDLPLDTENLEIWAKTIERYHINRVWYTNRIKDEITRLVDFVAEEIRKILEGAETEERTLKDAERGRIETLVVNIPPAVDRILEEQKMCEKLF